MIYKNAFKISHAHNKSNLINLNLPSLIRKSKENPGTNKKKDAATDLSSGINLFLVVPRTTPSLKLASETKLTAVCR